MLSCCIEIKQRLTHKPVLFEAQHITTSPFILLFQYHERSTELSATYLWIGRRNFTNSHWRCIEDQLHVVKSTNHEGHITKGGFTSLTSTRDGRCGITRTGGAYTGMVNGGNPTIIGRDQQVRMTMTNLKVVSVFLWEFKWKLKNYFPDRAGVISEL